MIDYLYLLDYEPDEDTGLRLVEPDLTTRPIAPDVGIDAINDIKTRAKISHLLLYFPHHGVSICLRALFDSKFNFFGAVEVLKREDIQAGRTPNLPYPFKQDAKASLMYSRRPSSLVYRLTMSTGTAKITFHRFHRSQSSASMHQCMGSLTSMVSKVSRASRRKS